MSTKVDRVRECHFHGERYLNNSAG